MAAVSVSARVNLTETRVQGMRLSVSAETET